MSEPAGFKMEDVAWRGRRIGDLPREDLLKIIYELLMHLQPLTSPEATRARALGKVEMLKRGESQ